MSEPNEPAFPVVWKNPLTGEEGTCVGMTTRQAFVMAAMQGMLANPSNSESVEITAKSSVQYADTCLAEEAKTRKGE